MEVSSRRLAAAGLLALRSAGGAADEVAHRAVLRSLEGTCPGGCGGVSLTRLVKEVGVRGMQGPVAGKLTRCQHGVEHSQACERTVGEPDRDRAVDLDDRRGRT